MQCFIEKPCTNSCYPRVYKLTGTLSYKLLGQSDGCQNILIYIIANMQPIPTYIHMTMTNVKAHLATLVTFCICAQLNTVFSSTLYICIFLYHCILSHVNYKIYNTIQYNTIQYNAIQYNTFPPEVIPTFMFSVNSAIN